jgi:hypothetical protein
VLGLLDEGERLQAAIVGELVQGDVAQFEPAVAVELALLPALGIEDGLAFARP